MRRLLSTWIVGGMILGSVLGCEKSPLPAPTTSNVSKARPVTKLVLASEPSTGPILTEEPTSAKPVMAQSVLRPAAGSNGSKFELIIEVRIAPGWHIYAADGTTGNGIPTALKYKLPDDVEATGEWQYPKTSHGAEEQTEIYEGNLQFRRELRITERAKPGSVEIHGELTYQACDAFHCLPPESLVLSATGKIVAAP